MKRVIPIIAVVVLSILIASAYGGTFYSPLILDDFHSFVYERSVFITDWTVSSLVLLSKTVFGWVRWLPMLSFSIDHWAGKGDIAYFHLTNLLIHLVCFFSLIFLAFNLLKAAGEKESDHGLPAPLLAIFVAGLWALHPVQTNAVTYLVQRMASIQALFFIASTAFYTLGRRKHIHEDRTKVASFFYVLSFLAAVAASLSKENAAMLPVMVLVTEIWFFSPDLLSSLWKRLRQGPVVLWAFLVLALVVLSFYGVRVYQDLQGGYNSRPFTMMERVLTEGRVVVWYASLLLWPAPSRMSIEHDFQLSTSLFNPLTTLPAMILVAVMGWLILRYRKRYPLLSYGGAWFLMNLVIESSVVPLELVFEHRLYLPSAGFCLAMGYLFTDLLGYLLANRSVRDVLILNSCCFALVFSALTLLTFLRNEAWSDNVSIYQDAVLKAPNNPRARANLAVAYGMSGVHEQAISEAEKAIDLGQRLNEQYAVASNTIVGSLIGLQRYEEAVERGEYLLDHAPEPLNATVLPNLYLNLAEAYLKSGHLERSYDLTLQALQWIQIKARDAVDLKLVVGMMGAILTESSTMQVDLDRDGSNDPGESSIKVWIARAFLERGEREEAKRMLVLASSEDPEDAEAVRLLEGIRREEELNAAQLAKENIKQKYVHHPFSRFNGCMALAYLARNEKIPSPFRKLGERFLDYALQIRAGAADAHLLKAWYLHDRRETERAIDSTQRTLAVDPDYAKAWMGLGFFLMESNRFAEAKSAFNRVLDLYPGCPQRKTILEVISGIEQNIPLATAQNNN